MTYGLTHAELLGYQVIGRILAASTRRNAEKHLKCGAYHLK